VESGWIVKITFRYCGDFTGITRQAEFNLSELKTQSPALAAALASVAKAVCKAPTARSTLKANAADQGLYEFDFVEEGRTHHIAYSRRSLPAPLRAEITTLMKAAQPIKPK
jgi:hypothetical protein